MPGIAQGSRKIACTQCGERTPCIRLYSTSSVFYRILEAYVKLRLRSVHRIAQHANTGNTDLDRVAGNERTYPGGRTGGDDVAGHQRHHARGPADKKRGRIGHQRSDPGLAACTVYVSLDEHVARVEGSFKLRSDVAEGCESLGARALYFTLLK